MLDFDAFLYDLIALLVIVDPVGVAAIFAALARRASPAERRRMALRGTIIASVLLVFFAFAGERLLRAMGVTLPAFQVAGGALLFLLAIEMVLVHHSGLRETTDAETAEAARAEDISVFPLAIPLLAGPGALTWIVLFMSQHAGSIAAEATMLLALGATMAITLLSLLAAETVVRLLGVTGINVVSRVLGIVLAALAAQLLLEGLRAALHLGN